MSITNADGDLGVGGLDFQIWLNERNGLITDRADFDKDGGTGGLDFQIWLSDRGPTLSPLVAPGEGLLRTITYEYDYAGRLVAVSDRDGADDPVGADYTYEYDGLNRNTLVEATLAGLAPVVALAQQFDLLGRRTQVAAAIGATDDFVNDYLYDSLSRLTRVTQQEQSEGNSVSEKRVDFGYNLAGQFELITRYADLAGTDLVAASAYGYDPSGRLTSLTHHSPLTVFAEYAWVWDGANRITQFNNSEHAGENVVYSYDYASQVTGANYSSQDDESYAYDDNGNRVTANGDTYVTGDNNQLADDDTYTYEYDREGNRTRRIAADGSYTVFEWDHRNRLVAVTDFDDEEERLQRVEYTYDAFDNLIGRKLYEGDSGSPSESGHFVYDGQQIVLVLDDEGDVENRYLWGPQVDQLLAQEDAGSDVLWALSDHLNTVRDWAEYDTGTTTVVDHAIFNAFGNRLDSPVVDSIFGWTGRYRDPATGLQYNWHRWYDPAVGRWLSQDPIGFEGKDSNLYRYVGNSPTVRVDPSGLITCEEKCGIILTAKLAVVTAALPGCLALCAKICKPFGPWFMWCFAPCAAQCFVVVGYGATLAYMEYKNCLDDCKKPPPPQPTPDPGPPPDCGGAAST